MANLASTYKNQERWKKTEELKVQVMETRKRVLGEEHPETLASINNLASTFLESRAMEGGRRAVCANDRDEKEGARRGASRHADQHGQSGGDVQESRAMEGSQRAGGATDGDKGKGCWVIGIQTR